MGEASFPLDIGKEWQYASFAAHATNPKKDQNGLGGSLQSERLLDAMMSSEKKDSHCPPMGLNRTLQSERLLGAMLPPNEKKDSHCSVGLSNAVGDKDANNRSWRDGYDMLGTSQRWIN
ncbi:hypothetical protein C0J52_03769 [Blattella germanica]|nr:hypothetical protein C0J52_03769 [Blattella germanica]